MRVLLLLIYFILTPKMYVFGQNSDLRKLWTFETEIQANLVLEYYEQFIFRNPKVEYMAVIKLKECEDNCYKIEVGVGSKNALSIKSINKEKALAGEFGINEIPETLPLPINEILASSSIKSSIGNKLSLYDINLTSEVQNISKDEYSVLREFGIQKSVIIAVKGVDVEDFLSNTGLPTEVVLVNKFQVKGPSPSNVKDSSIYRSDTIQDWYDQPPGGKSIRSGKVQLLGTLGGVFQLRDYGESLFGISNWHVLAHSRKLNEKVFATKGNSMKIGHTFWQKIDNHTEVAFVRFDSATAKRLKNAKTFNWNISSPKLGKKVVHFGYGSRIDTGEPYQESHIHSINATVRVFYDAYTNNHKIFRNQLLIKDFSTNSDSGALLFEENLNDNYEISSFSAVGLLFAKTEYLFNPESPNEKIPSISVANNINYIFDNSFKYKQEVLTQSIENVSYTRLKKKFIITKTY